MKLVLFDIDGTLVNTGGAGTRSMDKALWELFGIKDGFKNVRMAGKTDALIVREGLSLYGLDPENGNYEKVIDTYISHLGNELKTSGGKVMPGIREALSALSKRPDITLGLLTGNIEPGADLKLTHYAIRDYFSLGAYGSDHEDRNRLLPIAVERFKTEHRCAIDYSECVVVGDTPRDVECSKPFGALSITVATGPYSEDQLRSAEADHVFTDLSDTGAFLSLF